MLGEILTDAQQEQLKTERRWLTNLQTMLVSFGAKPGDRAALKRSVRQLDEPFLLVVVGELNAGNSAFINALLGQSFLEEGLTPTTTEEAQFNLAWPLAAYIVDGEIGPNQILEQAFEREDIRDLAERIEVVETEQLNELYRRAGNGEPRGKYVSKVIVELRDGRTVETGLVEGEINFPQDTWDEKSLEDKFRWLTGYVLDEGRIDALVRTAWRFEDVADAHELTEILA